MRRSHNLIVNELGDECDYCNKIKTNIVRTTVPGHETVQYRFCLQCLRLFREERKEQFTDGKTYEISWRSELAT